MVISWPTASRSVVGTSCTPCSVQLGLSQRLRHQWRQRLVGGSIASEPPRKIQALPLLIAQSGRFNRHVGAAFVNHAEHTDGHTHLAHADAAGLLLHAQISPMMSGMCGQLLDSPGRRSPAPAGSAAGDPPWARPSHWRRPSRSLALSTCKASTLSRSRRANASRALLLVAAFARAIWAEAGFCLQTKGVHIFGNIQRVHAAILAENASPIHRQGCEAALHCKHRHIHRHVHLQETTMTAPTDAWYSAPGFPKMHCNALRTASAPPR